MTGIVDRQTHPNLETWRNLLRRSLNAIADVDNTIAAAEAEDRPPWEARTPKRRAPIGIRLRGGTVLSALWGHRYSQDVDLFIHDAQLLAYLTPRLNDRMTDIMGATNYTETGTSLKFTYGPGKGSIDIVVAGDVLRNAITTVEEWEGRRIEIDDPAEIIAKKLFHRGDRATIRDYVDLVEGARQIPDLVTRLSEPLASTIKRTLAVARETSDQQIADGLSRIRFLKPAPAPAALRREALAVMQRIDGGGGGGGHAAFMAFQSGLGR